MMSESLSDEMQEEDHKIDSEEDQEERWEKEIKAAQVEESVEEPEGHKAVIEEKEKEENEKSTQQDDNKGVEDFSAFWKRHCKEKESACRHTRHWK